MLRRRFMKAASFRFILVLIFFPLATSCAGLHKGISSSSGDPAEASPTPASYYHTILGLQYEEDENDQAALKEYLAALRDDPNAFFLLHRAAAVLNRLGAQKEAASYAERALRFRPDDLKLLVLLGHIYGASGMAERAIDAYRRVIQIEPKEVEAYFRSAEIYASSNELEKAEEMVRKGVAADPTIPLGYYYLARIAVERKDLEEGLDYYKKAASLNPSFERAYLEMGDIYQRVGKAGEAEQTYRQILGEINPGSREARTRLVQLLVQEKSFDKALELLNGLAQEEAQSIEIALQTAWVLVEKKDIPGAIEKTLSVVKARPEDARLKIYLGSLYEENKEYEKAIETYQTVLGRGAAQKPREESSDAIEKTDYDIHLRLGSIYYYKLKKEQEALEQAALARRIDLQRPESYLFQGLVLYDTKRYEEATAVFIQGIEKNPKSPDLHFHLGAAYDKLNRFNDLIKEMEQAITLDAKHANALNYLGYTYAEKGIRINEAIDLINRALSVRPNDGYFIDSLGWAYYKKGMIRDAMVNLKKAVSLVPDDPVIREHLGEVYLQDKLTDLAREEWMHSLRLDPKNEKLLTRFKEAGFGEPILEESSERTNDLPQNPQTETSNQKEIPVESVH